MEADVQKFSPTGTSMFSMDPRTRRQNCRHMKKIVEMTRGNSVLYKNAIDSIKEEFKVNYPYVNLNKSVY